MTTPSTLSRATRQLTTNSDASFTYDNNGNMLTMTDANGTTHYSWDIENRLVQITNADGTVVTFKYDPFGRRIEKASAGTVINYIYDGANIVAEYDGSGALLAKYAQGAGIDEPLAINRGGITGYYHTDGLGSITSLTDANGATLNSYTYNSFGQITAINEAIANPFRYTGREWDQEIGLYYYRARYYESNIGRFLSEDPLRSARLGSTYSYVVNNPVFFVDPTGLVAQVQSAGGVITVSSLITIYGNAASATLAAKWQDAINNHWNNFGKNFKVGKCKVQFNINVQYSSVITLPRTYENIVEVNRLRASSFVDPGGQYGWWASDISDRTAAHEAGHLFGLPDRYATGSDEYGLRKTTPLSGFENDIMGSGSGNVTPFEVRQIVKNHNCGCK